MKRRLATIAIIGLAASAASAADTSWRRISGEQAGANPKNLAKRHLATALQSEGGAIKLSVDTRDENTSAAALLSDDATIGVPIVGGETAQVQLRLPEINVIKSVSFSNEGAAGVVRVLTALTRTAATNDSWHEAARQAFDATSPRVTIPGGDIDAKYVRIEIDVQESGRIRALGVFGEPREREFALRELDLEEGEFEAAAKKALSVDVNLLAAYAGARVLYVSSGSGNPIALVDGDASTSYAFAADDARPAAIFDLGQDRLLDRVSSIFTRAAAAMEVVPLAKLEETENWIGRTSLDMSSIAAAEAIEMGAAAEGIGRLALNFDPVQTRFVMVRFAPASQDAFKVSEVAAFSGALDPSFVGRSEYYASSEDAVEDILKDALPGYSLRGVSLGSLSRSIVSAVGGSSSSSSDDDDLDDDELARLASMSSSVAAAEAELDATQARIRAIYQTLAVDNSQLTDCVTTDGATIGDGEVSALARSNSTIPGIGHTYQLLDCVDALPDGFTLITTDTNGNTLNLDSVCGSTSTTVCTDSSLSTELTSLLAQETEQEATLAAAEANMSSSSSAASSD